MHHPDEDSRTYGTQIKRLIDDIEDHHCRQHPEIINIEHHIKMLPVPRANPNGYHDAMVQIAFNALHLAVVENKVATRGIYVQIARVATTAALDVLNPHAGKHRAGD